ncbi:MAG: ATP:cob(I)alamin adenosyltransferase [Coriobacteriia bacterium]|nr:ATP:cob(I)alamin adenosyltransferase [Coriobacteriia bacterium]
MAIYTRKGDTGSTSHVQHGRLSKGSIEIEVSGKFDSAITMMGFAGEALKDQARQDTRHMSDYEVLLESLVYAQRKLFTAAVCTFSETGCNNPLAQKDVDDLESRIDFYSEKLPALTGFVLPGGCEANARLNLARTSVRDLERSMVKAKDGYNLEDTNDSVLRYLNRLSDALYTYARYALLLDGHDEINWGA